MSTSTPALYAALVDDAAIFPPGNAALPAALAQHRSHRGAWYAGVVGPLLVSDVRLGELARLLATDPTDEPSGISVVVTGGAGAVGPSLARAAREPRMRVHGVEIALRDEEDLVRNAHRVVTALDAAVTDGAVAYFELPLGAAGSSWEGAADVVAGAGHRLKFRTGGETALAHPEPVGLATAMAAALDREIAFKCTAGLHHAVRSTDPGTGFEQHGFLNVALATGAALDGAGLADIAAVLASRDADAVAAACGELDDDEAARIRAHFASFGSCSVTEPVDDLVHLGLLSDFPSAVGR